MKEFDMFVWPHRRSNIWQIMIAILSLKKKYHSFVDRYILCRLSFFDTYCNDLIAANIILIV